MSEKVNKQLSISSCLKLFTEQMERGDKIFSQELIFRTDDPSSQHRALLHPSIVKSQCLLPLLRMKPAAARRF